VLLSAYLACYLPLFLWSARRLVHHWRWPLVPAATVAWVACEQLRGSLLGGFTFAGLGHTQWRWTALIQAADAVGEVGVGGIVMAGARKRLFHGRGADAVDQQIGRHVVARGDHLSGSLAHGDP
jgi:apolipoprotein N-acyltransferase